MTELEAYRREIDAIDGELTRLFLRRMEVTGRVGAYKQAHGLPVLDAAREKDVLARKAELAEGQAAKADVTALYETILGLSRRQQRKLVTEAGDEGYARIRAALAGARPPLTQPRVLYQGVPGAWSQIALQRLFPFARQTACTTWGEVFDAVQNEDAQFGVLPFENSNAGDVSAVLDLLYAHPGLKVARMCDLPIRQDLLALPGAQLSEIKTVISHQQALAQSGPFLKLHHFATKAWGNTADAARYVAEQGDQTLAAIASAETAKLYGLQILAEGVNEDGDNTTRFIVIEKEGAQRQPIAAAPGQRLSMLFTVDHKPGRLARVIQIIGERGFNMETIKSRPLPHVQFEYYFYVQLVCPANAATDDCAKLVHELENVCRTVRILGVFDL